MPWVVINSCQEGVAHSIYACVQVADWALLLNLYQDPALVAVKQHALFISHAVSPYPSVLKLLWTSQWHAPILPCLQGLAYVWSIIIRPLPVQAQSDKVRMMAGRLEDKAAIVRKCALQLLSKLLSFNPFGRYLPLDQMTASLKEYQAKLQARPLPAALWLAAHQMKSVWFSEQLQFVLSLILGFSNL